MKILVVNCNTTASITANIVATASAHALPGTEIIGAEPTWGVSSAEGFYESFVSAAAVLDLLATWPEPFDAVVMAGFGEHGREGARQLLDAPVVDITEAAVMVASLIGYRYGVVTTVGTTLGSIEQSLVGTGAMNRCAGVRASAVAVVDVDDDLSATVEALAVQAAELIELGADVMVLGCAGFAGLDKMLEDRIGVPVVDGVAAAVALCESLVRLKKTTSKAGLYARPSELKSRPGWPISTRAD